MSLFVSWARSCGVLRLVMFCASDVYGLKRSHRNTDYFRDRNFSVRSTQGVVFLFLCSGRVPHEDTEVSEASIGLSVKLKTTPARIGTQCLRQTRCALLYSPFRGSVSLLSAVGAVASVCCCCFFCCCHHRLGVSISVVAVASDMEMLRTS